MSELIKELYGKDFIKTPFQVLLQLDRYSIKELDTSKLNVGDIIVAIVDDSDPKSPQKDWGRVSKISDGHATFFGEMTAKEYTVPLRKVSIPLDAKWEDAVDRMVQGNLAIDDKYQYNGWRDAAFENRLRKALYNEWIVPGGRIQAMLGAREKYGKDMSLTAYNCYVIPSPTDSRAGIIETLGNKVEIMARGGGVGINLSTLRPKYAKVYGVNGVSSGAVSWGGVYSYTTGLIEQGGSRRGALMLQLHVTHPDVFEFITIKQKADELTNANLSVQITTEFMDAVKDDKDWHLIFPVTTHKEYEKWGREYPDIHAWLEAGLPVEIYDTVKARELFELIVESAWKSAEPGFVVYDRMNNGRMTPTQALIQTVEGSYVLDSKALENLEETTPWNNTYYYQRNISTNPCGEQPLPAWGICNLVHINLAEFYDDLLNDVAWGRLGQTVRDAVRFADNIIDYVDYHSPEIREVQMGQRRIGLGTLGLADLLIAKKLRYGSPESIEFIDELYRFIAVEAYEASVELAKDRGPFPEFSEKILNARVPKQLPERLRFLISKYGLRNSHLLTQAPTGTVGTKTGRRGYSRSTGIEPFFALSWVRESRMGKTRDYLGAAKEWLDAHPGEELPDYFVSAMCTNEDGSPKITPQQHVDVQATVQKWNDSAISKTTNVPANFTLEQTKELYVYGYEQGLIGITIYRDGSRDTQVLRKDNEDTDKPAEIKTEKASTFYKRPQVLCGETIKTPTPFGKAYVTINRNEAGEIEEVFVKLGKTGADIAAIADGLAIALTGMLSPRIANLPQANKIDWLIKKFSGISGATSVGFGPNRVDSLPDALAKVLALSGQDDDESADAEVSEEYDTIPATSVDLCPECGRSTFVRQDGCYTCLPDLGGCGYSKCG